MLYNDMIIFNINNIITPRLYLSYYNDIYTVRCIYNIRMNAINIPQAYNIYV